MQRITPFTHKRQPIVLDERNMRAHVCLWRWNFLMEQMCRDTA